MSAAFRSRRPVYLCCILENLHFAEDALLCGFLRLQLKLMKNRTRLAIGSHDADLVRFPLRLRTAEAGGESEEVFTALGDTDPRPLRELETRWLADPNKKAYVRRAFATAASLSTAAVCSDADGAVISLYPVSNGAKTASSSTMTRCFLEVSGQDGALEECQRAMLTMVRYFWESAYRGRRDECDGACSKELSVLPVDVRCEGAPDPTHSFEVEQAFGWFGQNSA